MKSPVFLLLLSLWVVPACKKSALPIAGGNTLNKTVVTIPGTSPSQSVDSFIYDGQQRLAEEIFSGSNSSISDTVTFQYDGSGRVQSWMLINSGLGRVITYELSYDGTGHLVKAMAVPLLPDHAYSDYSFAYDVHGHLVTDTIYAQHLAGVPNAGITGYDIWTYDENGNIITDQFFASTNTNLIGAPFTSGGINTYRHDNQINPYYHAGIPFFSYGFDEPTLLSPNNVAGGTTVGTSALSPYTYSYSYYSNGQTRVQTTPVYVARGTVTQTTLYFYQ